MAYAWLRGSRRRAPPPLAAAAAAGGVHGVCDGVQAGGRRYAVRSDLGGPDRQGFVVSCAMRKNSASEIFEKTLNNSIHKKKHNPWNLNGSHFLSAILFCISLDRPIIYSRSRSSGTRRDTYFVLQKRPFHYYVSHLSPPPPSRAVPLRPDERGEDSRQWRRRRPATTTRSWRSCPETSTYSPRSVAAYHPYPSSRQFRPVAVRLCPSHRVLD